MTILQQPKLVVVESPFRATPYFTEEQHRLYLQHCLEDCLKRGESPYASHHYLTTVLDDDDPAERAWGLKCGWAWGAGADLIAAYTDFGVSEGMKDSIEHYSKLGKTIDWRKLPHKVVASIKQFGEPMKEEPPDERRKLWLGGCATATVIAASVLAPRAEAHSWYSERRDPIYNQTSCCGGQDCAPLPAHAISITPDGNLRVTLTVEEARKINPIRRYGFDRVIEFERIQDSEDGTPHICLMAHDLEGDPREGYYCVFLPLGQ